MTRPAASKTEPSNGASGSGVEPGSTTSDHQPRPRSEEPAPLPFPCDTLEQAAEYLRRPFTAEAVRFKVQRTLPVGAEVVTYIDARLVIERLNMVVPGRWTAFHKRIEPDGLVCEMTVCGVPQEDIGDGRGKTAYSDSLKRAAVRHGIGVSIYALPKAVIKGDKIKKEGKATLITEVGDKWLREAYQGWLDRTGIDKFGEPLDHGDVIGAQGDPDEPEPDSETADGVQAELDYQPPEPVKGEEADQLRTAIDGFYAEIRSIDPTFLLPAVYKRELEIAGGSIDDLTEYSQFMFERLKEMQARP